MNLTESMILNLRSTGFWAKFMAILFYIALGFVALAEVFVLIAAVAQLNSEVGMAMLFAFVIYGVIGVFLFIFAQRLWRFGSFCTSASITGSAEDLAQAQENNYRFWRLYGILGIIGIAIGVLAIIGLVIFGVAAASGIR